MVDADLVVVLLDGSQNLTDEDRMTLEAVRDLKFVIAVNKIDLKSKIELNLQIADCKSSIAYVSAKTGEGLDELQNTIVKPFISQNLENSGFLVSDARHNDLLVRTGSEIENSIGLIDRKMSEEIILIGLHNALRFLGQITGETTTEDMLARIFSTFCIGK
jgi:tRNA modification GTPase